MSDQVNSPKHYTFGKIEVIDAIEDWKLGFHLGNVVKYVARAGHKGTKLEDLKKARWYLDRMIKTIEVNDFICDKCMVNCNALYTTILDDVVFRLCRDCKEKYLS